MQLLSPKHDCLFQHLIHSSHWAYTISHFVDCDCEAIIKDRGIAALAMSSLAVLVKYY